MVPDRWKEAFTASGPGGEIVQHVPQDQTFRAWRDMVISVRNQNVNDITPENASLFIAKQYRDSCGRSEVQPATMPAELIGKMYVVLLRCWNPAKEKVQEGVLPRPYEAVLSAAYDYQGSIYLLQYAWRNDRLEPPIDEAARIDFGWQVINTGKFGEP